jgi:hypothetical protein
MTLPSYLYRTAFEYNIFIFDFRPQILLVAAFTTLHSFLDLYVHSLFVVYISVALSIRIPVSIHLECLQFVFAETIVSACLLCHNILLTLHHWSLSSSINTSSLGLHGQRLRNSTAITTFPNLILSVICLLRVSLRGYLRSSSR